MKTLRRNLLIAIVSVPLLAGLAACAEASSAASAEISALPEPKEIITTAMEKDPTAGVEGWGEETHSRDAEPNYEVVFPEDKVNQIKITIAPDDWEEMQANMTVLFGEAGSKEEGGREPDDRQPPGEAGFPRGFEPPDGAERPAPPEGGLPNEPLGGPGGGQEEGFLNRPPGGGLRGGDITPVNPMWVPATIEFEGNTWTNVGIRYKGNSSLTSGWHSDTLKLPLKLDFDQFEHEHPEIEDQRFYGFKQLSLANGFSDGTFLRDAASALVFEQSGLPVAKTAFYEVILDHGEGPVTLGLYTMIEVVDDTVVDRFFSEDDGNIYEADGPAASLAASTYDQIEESFQKENNEDKADWSDIEGLFNGLHSDQRTNDPAAWRASLEAIFDVEGFLNWLAVSAVIQHWDAYGNMSHNYYLYHDPDTDKLVWISWDHNMAMPTGTGRERGPGGKSVSLDNARVDDNWPLIRFLLNDPVYYEEYLGYLEATVEGAFNPDKMSERYQKMAELIAPYARAEVGEAEFEAAVQLLIDHAYQRADAVEAFLSENNQY